VVCALGHGVRLAEGVVAEVASCDNASVFEPIPRSADLAAIAAHAEAGQESAAASGVGCGQQ